MRESETTFIASNCLFHKKQYPCGMKLSDVICAVVEGHNAIAAAMAPAIRKTIKVIIVIRLLVLLRSPSFCRSMLKPFSTSSLFANCYGKGCRLSQTSWPLLRLASPISPVSRLTAIVAAFLPPAIAVYSIFGIGVNRRQQEKDHCRRLEAKWTAPCFLPTGRQRGHGYGY